jgi:hypothetical protein
METRIEILKSEMILKWGFESEETVCFFSMCEKVKEEELPILEELAEVFLSEEYEIAKREREE